MNSGNCTFLLVLLFLVGAAATHAQSLEMPKIEYANDLCELRIENRVFVQAPLSTRQALVKELREHSDLVIVERPVSDPSGLKREPCFRMPTGVC
ncbi:MAG TPA: hypothetical protein VK582_06600 [Pyrinomonadaceae bacterium]|nr:hypothetical protein [Pyrinomonadaceae bacterium]